jgi:hypothetical protein
MHHFMDLVRRSRHAKLKCTISLSSRTYTKTAVSVDSQRLGVFAILPRMDFPPYITLPPGVFNHGRWLASDYLLEESRFAQMLELPHESEIRKNYAKVLSLLFPQPTFNLTDCQEMEKRRRRIQVIMEVCNTCDFRLLLPDLPQWAGKAQEWSTLYETKKQAALRESGFK